jgi:DNA-binding NarL/FixJ family response regulator
MRVLVADDNRGIRIGLSAALSSHHDVEVVGEAADGLEAVDLAIRPNPTSS